MFLSYLHFISDPITWMLWQRLYLLARNYVHFCSSKKCSKFYTQSFCSHATIPFPLLLLFLTVNVISSVALGLSLSPLHTFFNLIPTTAPWSQFSHYPHFADKQLRRETLNNSSKVIQTQQIGQQWFTWLQKSSTWNHYSIYILPKRKPWKQ